MVELYLLGGDRPPSERLSSCKLSTKVKRPKRFSVVSERLSTIAVVVGGERLGEMGGGDRH